MTETREFHIGEILTVTLDKLLSPRHMGGVYEILHWMTGDPVYTDQVPQAIKECAPSLREQHPDLAAVTLPADLADSGAEDAVLAWLAEQVEQYGETRPVRPLGR